jgi:plastocyanin
MVRVRLVVLTLSSFVALVLAGSVLANSSVRISESNNRYLFGPAKVFITVGQKVTWANGSDAPHTVTSNSGTELASPSIAAGVSFSHTFAATGTYAYHCSIHTYMKGTVVVLAAGTSLPPTDTVGHPTTGSQQSAVAALGLIALFLCFIVARLGLRRRQP